MSRSASRVSSGHAVASALILCAALGVGCGEGPERPATGDGGTDRGDVRDDRRETTDSEVSSDPDPGDDATTEPTGACYGYPAGEPSDACAGNVGCTELGVSCGDCACTLCWNETCLQVTCDDGGPGCEVPVSGCGERVFACGSFDTPVYGGDPIVCQNGCAYGETTCAGYRRCEAGLTNEEIDDATACQRACEGCGQTSEDCATLCAPEGPCYAALLAATSCAEVEACMP